MHKYKIHVISFYSFIFFFMSIESECTFNFSVSIALQFSYHKSSYYKPSLILRDKQK